MRGPALVAFLLFVAAACLRPPSTMDQALVESGLLDAKDLQANTEKPRDSSDDLRGFDDDYKHWSPVIGSGPQRAVQHIRLEKPNPVAGMLAALSGGLGLRELVSQGLYMLANQAEEDGDRPQSALLLETTTLLDPHFIQAFTLLAYAFRAAPDRAEQVLRRGLMWNSGDWELWYDLAWLKLRPVAGHPPDYKTALEYLEGAVSTKHPFFVSRLFAMTLQAVGRKKDAQAVYRNLLDTPDITPIDRANTLKGLRDVEQGVMGLQSLLRSGQGRLR